MKRKYIIPLIALLTFAAGCVSIMLPFLPFGWFLWAVTALILTPYIQPIKKFFLWLQTKDNKGFTDKAIERVARLYQWAGDHKRSDQMRETFKRRDASGENSEKEKSAKEGSKTK